jgi:glutamine synthetase
MNITFQALRASNRKPVQFETDRKSTIFGSNVFNDKAMKQYLTSDAFKGVQGAVQHGTKIDRKLADYIAMGMKKGASKESDTHTLVSAYRNYCRKHDAFETSYDGSDQ